MSLLQAARAYTLGLPLESAYSWGLNRAIFIAAAKRGFKGGGGGGKAGEAKGERKSSKGEATYSLGDDMAFKAKGTGTLLFTFGGKVQTKEEFDKRVKARFGSTYSEAWKESLAYVKGFDKETLLSTEGFYRDVYKPVRDSLAERWSAAADQSQVAT